MEYDEELTVVDERVTALALLNECLSNGDSGAQALYAWFCGERAVIVDTIDSAAKAQHENERNNKLRDALYNMAADEIQKLRADKAVIRRLWHSAAFRAEQETAARFGHNTCNMKNADGFDECPLCYFSQRLRALIVAEMDRLPRAAAQTPCKNCGNVGTIERNGIKQCDACGFPE